MVKIELALSSEELSALELFKNRQGKFNVEFTNFLTDKINSNLINCELVMISNYFLKLTKAYYWRGLYRCKVDKCNIFYRVFKKSKNSQLLLLLANGTCSHDVNEKKVRTTGEARKELQNKILAFGSLNTQANNIIFNEMNKDDPRMLS